MSRKSHSDQGDDLTFAAMTEPEASAPRRRGKADPKYVDPWDRVAAECPCRASAASHRNASGGIVRVHVTAYKQHVLCVPGDLGAHGDAVPNMPSDFVVHNAQWNIGIAYRWRKTSVYGQAELVR